MTPPEDWLDIGSADELARRPLAEVRAGRLKLALSHQDGVFGAVSAACNHVGGPLGQGRLQGEYIECPWHYWKFHRVTGEGEPGYESDRVPRHDVKVENGRVLISRTGPTSSSSRPPSDGATRPRSTTR